MTMAMWISLAGILLTNVVLVIGATWRMAGVIQQVITRLDGIKDLMDLNNKHTEQRVSAIEAQVGVINQTILDMQKRQTAMELQMSITMKRE